MTPTQWWNRFWWSVLVVLVIGLLGAWMVSLGLPWWLFVAAGGYLVVRFLWPWRRKGSWWAIRQWFAGWRR